MGVTRHVKKMDVFVCVRWRGTTTETYARPRTGTEGWGRDRDRGRQRSSDGTPASPWTSESGTSIGEDVKDEVHSLLGLRPFTPLSAS